MIDKNELEENINKLTATNDQVLQAASEITTRDQKDIIENATENQVVTDPESEVFTGEQVDVAGILKKGINFLEGGEETVKQRQILNKSIFDKIDPNDGDYIVKPYGDVDATEVLDQASLKQTEGKQTRIKSRGKGTPDVNRFNLNNINGPDSLKQFINFVGDAYPANLKQMPIKKLAEELSGPVYRVLNNEGRVVKKFKDEKKAQSWIDSKDVSAAYSIEKKELYDAKFIQDILNPAKKTVADPVLVRKMLVAQVDVAEKADDLARQVLKMDADGTLTPDVQVQFEQMFALLGELNKAIEGRTADIGRTLRMFGEARTAKGSMPKLEFLEAQGANVGDTVKRAKQFLAINTVQAKGQASEVRFSLNTAPEIAIKMWQTAWINGLLSSPITHAKNMISNFAYGAWQAPVRFTAGAIGLARKNIFRQDVKTIQMMEGWTYATNYFGSWRDSLALGAKAFKQNAPLDGKATKLELDGIQSVFDDVSYGDTQFGKAMKTGMSYYGKFVTLPGRFLLAEDEMFKGAARFAEFKVLAGRAKDDYVDTLITKGEYTPDEIMQMGNAYYQDIINNPPADMIKQAVEHSKEITFTKELEGTMKNIQKMINNTSAMSLGPYAKLFAPFIRTPTNLVTEALKHTPAMFLNPNFVKSIKTGGRQADLALAKVGLGSGVMATMASYAMDGRFTGAGPGNDKLRKTYEATGWQKYSIVFDSDQFSEAGLEELRTYGTVTQGAGKIYWSFDGLQPLSTLLGVGATIGEYFMANSYANAQGYGSQELDEQILMVGVMAGYDILSEMPMLQAVGDMVDTVVGGKNEDEILRAIKNIKNKGGEFLIQGSPLGLYQSGKATIERFLDPTQSSFLPSGEDSMLDYSWNKYKSRLPFYSNDLPPRLDPLTGETVEIGLGNFYELFSPFKKSNGKYIEGYQDLINWNVEVYVPPVKRNGYELTAAQYNDWITLATENGQLQKRVSRIAQQFRNESDVASVQTKLRNEMSSAYKKAFAELQKVYPEIADFYDEKELQDKDLGTTKWN